MAKCPLQQSLTWRICNAISNSSSAGMNKMFKVTLPSHPRSGTSQYINHSGPIDRSSSTFSSLSISLYNNLPVELKILMISTKTFKTKVKSYNLSINTLISNKWSYLQSTLRRVHQYSILLIIEHFTRKILLEVPSVHTFSPWGYCSNIVP